MVSFGLLWVFGVGVAGAAAKVDDAPIDGTLGAVVRRFPGLFRVGSCSQMAECTWSCCGVGGFVGGPPLDESIFLVVVRRTRGVPEETGGAAGHCYALG